MIALDIMVRTGPLESRNLTDGGQECEAVPRGAARGAQQSLFSDASWHRYCTYTSGPQILRTDPVWIQQEPAKNSSVDNCMNTILVLFQYRIAFTLGMARRLFHSMKSGRLATESFLPTPAGRLSPLFCHLAARRHDYGANSSSAGRFVAMGPSLVVRLCLFCSFSFSRGFAVGVS